MVRIRADIDVALQYHRLLKMMGKHLGFRRNIIFSLVSYQPRTQCGAVLHSITTTTHKKGQLRCKDYVL